MCGLVGIDAGVLDQRVDVGLDRLRIRAAGHHADSDGAIEVCVDITGAGDIERGKSPWRAEFRHDLLRDNFGSFAKLTREFKGDGRGELAELQVRRSLQRNVLDREVVLGLEHVAEVRLEPVLEFLIHAECLGNR